MSSQRQSAIARLVDHHDGPTALSRKLGGRPQYQQIQAWVKRGWASPMHIFRLKPLLPRGIKLEDLYQDRMHADSEQEAA
jgi:hypothetical protein